MVMEIQGEPVHRRAAYGSIDHFQFIAIGKPFLNLSADKQLTCTKIRVNKHEREGFSTSQAAIVDKFNKKYARSVELTFEFT